MDADRNLRRQLSDFPPNGGPTSGTSRWAHSLGRAQLAWRSWTFCIIMLLSMLVIIAPARAAAPDDIMRRLADELTDAVRADKELQNPYSERMAEFMRKHVVPRFNFEVITRSVVGKSWFKATSQERRALIDQFSQLMIRSYSKAVAKLKDYDIEVQSVKVITPNESVVVHTRMIGLPQSYNIDYDMTSDGTGWRVHDITFEGMSLVNSYRDEFNTLIADNGIDGLIADLEKKNSK